MNSKIEKLLFCLEETPRLLKELIAEIPPELYKKRILKDKWTIHENATHIAITDKYGFQKRLELFKNEAKPIIEPLSGANFKADFFMKLDLNDSLDHFFDLRKKTIHMAKNMEARHWNKEAIHPEYNTYTPYIMLRHLLMHDHMHLYKIEDMGFGIGHVK